MVRSQSAYENIFEIWDTTLRPLHPQRLRLKDESGASDSELWSQQTRRGRRLVHVALLVTPHLRLRLLLAHYPALTTHVTTDYFKAQSELYENGLTWTKADNIVQSVLMQ